MRARRPRLQQSASANRGRLLLACSAAEEAEEAAAVGARRVGAAHVVHVLEDVRVEALLARDGAGPLDQAYVTGLGPSKDPQTYVCVYAGDRSVYG